MSEKVILTKAYISQQRDQRKRWKEIRQMFMDKDPHCHYCGVEVVYYRIPDHVSIPDNFATIDHLYDKLDPRRYKVYKDYENLVLACNKCNFSRHQARHLSMTKEQKRERSAMGNLRPKNMPRIYYFQELDL